MAGPLLVRRQLGRRLRVLRDRAGMSEADVATSKLMSKAKLWRIETGRVAVGLADVWGLCRLYKADAATTDALGKLSEGTHGHGWWEKYSSAVPEYVRLHIDLGDEASAIREFHPELVPGLFQTADYATAVHRAVQQRADEQVRRWVELRMQRQQTVFGRVPPPRIIAVIGAAALIRRVGGPAVRAAQLKHLEKLADLHHVDLRVLPLDTQAHAAMAGGFTIFDSNSTGDPNVVYLETEVGAWYLEQDDELALYRRQFEQVYDLSVPFKEFTP